MKKRIDRLCVLVGVFLLLIAAGLMLGHQWRIAASQRKAEAYVRNLRTLIPTPIGAAPEAKMDNSMPVLSVEGTNFSGILEMPAYGLSLPVCAEWGDITKYPCCFNGSVYDRTIQIGATSQKGQLDFYREISVGDAVYFTDMEGKRFSYQVTDIQYEKHADQVSLGQKSAALTLFIKNVYAFEYIVIFCDTPG